MSAGRHHTSEMWQASAQAVSQRRGRPGEDSEQARRQAALAWNVLAWNVLAWNVLAGRRTPRPWLPPAGPAALGIVARWAAAQMYHSRRPHLEHAINAAGQHLQQTKTAVQERITKAKAAPGGPVDKAKAALTSDDATDATDADGTADKPSTA